MTCVICKHGTTVKGTTTLTFNNDNSTSVVKNIPADVCDNCSEALIDEDISRQVFEEVMAESKKSVVVEVANYAAYPDTPITPPINYA